ncbi:MAG: hypothetical protein AAF958_12720 [Planctomycetota bacterium]
MLRRAASGLLFVLLCLKGEASCQLPEASEQTAKESIGRAVKPFSSGISYRQWYRTKGEREEYAGTKKDPIEELLEGAEDVEVTDNNQRKARGVLGRMAAFLASQESVQFTLEYELNQQIVMGAVGSFNSAFERFEIQFAKPNLLKITDSHDREEKNRWEMGSDGRYLQRVISGMVAVEEVADSLPEMLRQSGTQKRWDYFLNPRELLSLFNSQALTERLEGWGIRYGGTRDFGDVLVDYVLLDFPQAMAEKSVYKRIHLFVAQGEYPLPLMMVRDGDRFYSSNFRLDDPSNRTRSLDTEWRFTDWKLNAPVRREDFKLSMPKQPPVQSMEKLSPPKLKLAAFVGNDLPEFNVVDGDGKVIRSTVLLDGKPTVLLLWHDRARFLEDWREAASAERKFGVENVHTIGVYVGAKSGDPETRRQILKSVQNTEAMAEAGVVIRPRVFFAQGYRDTRVLQEERYALLGVCAVVDSAGTVVDKYPGPGGRDFARLGIDATSAILEGKDFVAQQLQGIAETKATLQRQRDDWNRRFESSWKAADHP